MGVITISLDNTTEKKLREYSKKHFGDRKDALSKTIIQAISLMDSQDQDNIEKLKSNMCVQKKQIKTKKIPQTRVEYYEK